MRRVGLRVNGVPEMMGDEFQEQAFRRRPGQRAADRCGGPGLEIGEIGGQCPQRVVAHARGGEMLEGLDIVVGQDFGELVAAVERQDGVERIEFGGALEHGIGWNSGQGAFYH